MNNKRLIWVDSLKGWLILLVVMGHAIQYCMKDGECESNYWWNLIYSFHMPAFMALSGFVNYRPTPPRPYRTYLTLFVRRTRQLLVPFFLWSIIKWIVVGSLSLDKLIHITFGSGGFFWFLWVLWVISIIFMSGNLLSKVLAVSEEIIDGVISLALVLVMVLGDIRILGFHYISYYFVFYTIGYYCNKYNRLLAAKKQWLLLLSGMAWFLMASFWNMHQLPFFLKGVPYVPKTLLLYTYRFATAFIGIYALIGVGRRFLNRMNSFNIQIAHLGKVSLGLYVTHLVLIISLSGWLVASFPLCPLPILILLSFISVCLMAISIVELISRFNITAKLLLGKV